MALKVQSDHPHSHPYRKKAKCLEGMSKGVRDGATVVSPLLPPPCLRCSASRACRCSFSLRSHASTTCSSFLPCVSSGRTER